MAVDRGGLNYRIRVRFNPAPVQEFREEIRGAKRDAAAFFSTLRRQRQFTRGLRDSTRALRDQARASDLNTQASQRRERAQRRQLTIEQELERRAARAARSRQIALAAQERGINLSSRVSRTLSIEERAQQRVGRALANKAVQERAAAIAGQRAVDLGLAKARALTVEEEAQKRLDALVRRRAVQQRLEEVAAERGVELANRRAQVASIEERALALVSARRAQLNVRERAAAIAGQEAVQLGLAKARAATVEEEGLRRVEQRLRRQAVAQAQINELRRRGLRIPPDVVRQARGFDSELQRINSSGSRLLFTFRRLFGVLALFQGVRLIFAGFREGVRSALEFNSVIEQSELGISAVIAAVGDLRNGLGNAVPPAQELELAIEQAQRQVRLLQQDALLTTATFEELLGAFQVAIAPGLTAGLDLDQVREFSVRISQAAAALGVAQNQLSEEIRSILAGTIQLRTTRIAAALGITNEDIRRAREAGVLFEFLRGEFEAFEAAGERALGTFGGLFARVRDGLRRVLGDASFVFFENIKTTLEDIFQLLTVENVQTGLLEPNPQVAAVFREIFDVLSEGLDSVREGLADFGFEDAQTAARAFSQALLTGFEFLVGAAVGFGQALVVITEFLEGFAGERGQSVRDLGASFARLTAFAVTLLIPLRIILSLFGSIAGAVGLTRRGIQALGPVLTRARLAAAGLVARFPILLTLLTAARGLIVRLGQGLATLARAGGPAAILLGIFTLAGVVFDQITEKIFGINTSFSETFQLLGAGIAGFVADATDFFAELATSVAGFIERTVRGAIAAGENLIREARRLAAELTGNSEESIRLAQEGHRRELEQEAEIAAVRARTEAEVQRIRESNAATNKALEEEIAGIIAGAAAREVQGPGFDDDFARGLADGQDSADNVLTIFESIPSAVSTVSNEIQGLQESLADLERDARRAGGELEFAQARAGVGGVAAEIGRSFDQNALQLRENALDLDRATEQVRTRIAALEDARLRTLQRGTQLQQTDQVLILQALEARQALLRAEENIAVVDQDIRRTRLEIAAARERGDAATAGELRSELASLQSTRDQQEAIANVVSDRLRQVQLSEQASGVLEELATQEQQLASAEADLVQLTEARLEQQRELTQLAAIQAATTAVQRTPQIVRENELLLSTLRTEQAIAVAEQQRLGTAALRVIRAQGAVDQAEVELRLKREQAQIELQSLRTDRDKLEVGSDERQALDRIIEALEIQLELEEGIAAANLQQLRERQRLAELAEDGTLGEGFQEGLLQFAEEFGSAFEAGIQIARDAIQELSSFAAQTIVQAITTGFEEGELEQALGQLLQRIATNILQTLIQQQLAALVQRFAGEQVENTQEQVRQAREQQLLLQRRQVALQEQANTTTFSAAVTTFAGSQTVFTTAATTFNTGASILAGAAPTLVTFANTLLIAAQIQLAASTTGGGAAEGGRIRAGFAPSRAHFSNLARGYSLGGGIQGLGGKVPGRPANIDPRDTVPIWAQPGEYMFSKKAVQSLGLPFLEMLHGFGKAGFGKNITRRAVNIPRMPGFQEGGLVSEQLQQSVAAQTPSDEDAGGAGLVLPVLTADTETADQLLAGGLEEAILEMLHRNGGTVAGIVNGNSEPR